MQSNESSNTEMIYICWNVKGHKDLLSEFSFTGHYNKGEIVKCPNCGQSHKITNKI